METFTEANGQLEDAVICREDDDVARRIQDRGTNLAVLQMPWTVSRVASGRAPSRYSEI